MVAAVAAAGGAGIAEVAAEGRQRAGRKDQSPRRCADRDAGTTRRFGRRARRHVHRRQPARAACTAGRATGAGGAQARCPRVAPQPQHRVTVGRCGQPLEDRDVGCAQRGRSGGPGLGQPGRRDAAPHPGAGGPQVRRSAGRCRARDGGSDVALPSDRRQSGAGHRARSLRAARSGLDSGYPRRSTRGRVATAGRGDRRGAPHHPPGAYPHRTRRRRGRGGDLRGARAAPRR